MQTERSSSANSKSPRLGVLRFRGASRQQSRGPRARLSGDVFWGRCNQLGFNNHGLTDAAAAKCLTIAAHEPGAARCSPSRRTFCRHSLLADKAIPLVATRGIGTAAARLLAEGGSGKRVLELAGPREYSPRDVAAAVGRIVGKPIDVQQAPEEAMAPALMGAGMNAEWARLFQELTHGLNANLVVWEGGHPLWRGETDVQTVLLTLIRT